ncbi:MAG: glycosyltransferase [Candidatus Woesearchaeota archaeon]
MEKINLSLIIPVNNEEKIIEKNSLKLLNHLKNSSLIDKYEILLCENGSTDKTYEIAKGLARKYKRIRAFHADKRGIGLGIKQGILNAKYEYLKKQDIDIPFGLGIIEDSIKAIKDADVVIDSKGHPNSIIERSFIRRVYSRILNIIVNLMFRLKIKDTQGTALFKRSNVNKFINKLNSENAFLQTQIMIYSRLNGNRIKEIPVRFVQTKLQKEETRIRPFRDGIRILFELVGERFKIWFSH